MNANPKYIILLKIYKLRYKWAVVKAKNLLLISVAIRDRELMLMRLEQILFNSKMRRIKTTRKSNLTLMTQQMKKVKLLGILMGKILSIINK
jgi:hypothetical protein